MPIEIIPTNKGTGNKPKYLNLSLDPWHVLTISSSKLHNHENGGRTSQNGLKPRSHVSWVMARVGIFFVHHKYHSLTFILVKNPDDTCHGHDTCGAHLLVLYSLSKMGLIWAKNHQYVPCSMIRVTPFDLKFFMQVPLSTGNNFVVWHLCWISL